MALGKLLKLDPATGTVLTEVSVGPRPCGIAVSHDGKDVYVTRFISPDTGGEVVKVDASAMTVTSMTRRAFMSPPCPRARRSGAPLRRP